MAKFSEDIKPIIKQAKRARRAELSVVGTLLVDSTCFDDIACLIDADDFRDDILRTFYKVVAKLCLDKKVPTLVMVAEELQRQNLLDRVGGYPAISDIHGYGSVPEQAIHNAEVVRDLAICRRLANAGRIIQRLGDDPHGSAAQMLQEAEQAMSAVSQLRVRRSVETLADAIQKAMDLIEKRSLRDKAISGIPTGLQSLDGLTAGFQDCELTLLAARPSVGKTGLALNLAANVAKEGNPVLFCSLEQSGVELALRVLSLYSGIEGRLLKQGTISEQEGRRLTEAQGRVSPYPVFLDDTANQSLSHIGSVSRRLQRTSGLRLLVIDYLQLIAPEDRKPPEHERLGAISRGLKMLAKELAIPVLALAQLRRESEQRADPKPKLSDLKGSGSLEQDADVVILLHCQDRASATLEVEVAKNRNGPVGEFVLNFNRGEMRVTDWHKDVF